MELDKKVVNEFEKYKKGILDELKKISLPKGHPFLKYPTTPESRNLEFFILLSMLLGEESNIPKKLLQKCNAVEEGEFSHMKFLEGLDEVLILYYILIVNMKNVSSVIYQDKLINCYSKQHQSVLLKNYKEMIYFSGDFPFDSNAFFTLSISSMDNIFSISSS